MLAEYNLSINLPAHAVSFTSTSDLFLVLCISCACWTQIKIARSLTACGWTFLMKTAVTG